MNENPVLFVTGGGYGIGSGIARYFAERTYAVAIADKNFPSAEQVGLAITQSGGHALALFTDIRDPDSVSAAIERTLDEFGQIDVLCNNAGIEMYRRAQDYTIAEWDAILETNLRGPFLCAKFAYPALRKRRGCIINISSVQALACEPQISAYAASKAGLLALTRGMALDFAADGVRVNAICPGAVNTGMLENALTGLADPEAVLSQLANSIPLGRIGEPVDIAGLAYFLASREAAYITGSSFVVDGGLLGRLATLP